MTKKRLEELLEEYDKEGLEIKDHYYDVHILLTGAELFVEFLDKKGYLQPDTNEILQDAWGESPKLNQ